MTNQPRSEFEELLPCPFCGGDNLGYSRSEYCSTVICKNCEGCMQRSNADGAFPAWNTRRTPDALIDEIESILEKADDCANNTLFECLICKALRAVEEYRGKK